MSTECRFWIYIEGNLRLGPLVDKETQMEELLWTLHSDQFTLKYFKGVNLRACTLYKFPTPLLAIGKLADRVKACSDASDDWVEVDRTEWVKDLASDEYLSDKYVCLAIRIPPKDEQEGVFRQLRTIYGTLFEALQLVVYDIKSLCRDDVSDNLKSGGFWCTGSDDPRMNPDMKNVESQLLAKRTYNVATHSQTDLDIANRYPEHFTAYFEEQSQAEDTPEPVVNFTREFVAFFSLLRCHMEDIEKIADWSTSSRMKADHFRSYFFIPPFLHCKSDNSKTFVAENPWEFPLFLATFSNSSTWSKTTPSSHFSVRVKDFNLPLLVSEVSSMPQEEDRWCMLLQGIALARVLYVLKKPITNTQFFSAVIYLRSDFIVERYIIMQTHSDGTVSIGQKDYNLKRADHSRDFLREMFNLQTSMEAMANELDDAKTGELGALADIADQIISLSQRLKETKSVTTSKRFSDSEYDFTQEDDVQRELRNRGYESLFILFGHPHIAMIHNPSDPSKRGYLKCTDIETEVEILEHLTAIQASDNHTIPGTEIWSRRAGKSLIYTPSGGSHLTDLNKPDEHMWSAAKQLIEGVAFMHKNDVAHLDIKPSNVLIPVNGGRLSIIDFNSAVFVKPGKKFRGEIGTEGYMAPEVSTGQVYDACRADLWSCGKTLLDLVDRCDPTAPDSSFVADIANRLMVSDPLGRPTMLEVLDHIRAFESSPVERPKMSLRSPMTIVGARA